MSPATTMWTPLGSWVAVSIVVPIIIGIGVGVLSMSPPEFFIAKTAFTLGAAILAVRVGWWIAFETRGVPDLQRVVSAGIAFGFIGAAWIGAVMWVHHREPGALSLVIECQPWMKKPIESSAIVLPLSPDTRGLAIERTEHFHANSWTRIPYETVHFDSINRWQLTNYGPAPVFKVSFVLTLNFRQAGVGQGSDTAPIVMSREWPVNINKIDPGSGSAFVFYAANRSPHLLQIVPSESATLEVLGETQRRTVSVRGTERTFYDLVPGITSAPAPPDATKD